MDKKTLVIGVLFVLLLVSVGYIAWNEYEAEKVRTFSSGYQQGYSYGVTETVYSLLQQTNGCNAATVNFGNFTRVVIDTACLQKVSE